jgi:hypothetical protein
VKAVIILLGELDCTRAPERRDLFPDCTCDNLQSK